jgi:DNA modification methylase
LSVLPAGLVCDPYCGTGTTGEVALELGGRFLLSDVSSHWAEYTTERMNNALQRLQQRSDKTIEN